MSKRIPVLDLPGHPCDGHPCDRCHYCESGTCCGEAVVEADLPEAGSWKGDQVVLTGTVKITQEGKIVCHICGGEFTALWMHIQKRHGIDADQYRAYFGLRTTEPLCGPAMYEGRSERQGAAEEARNEEAKVEQAARLEKYRMDFTREQRSIWSRSREQRLQAVGAGIARQSATGAAAWQQRRLSDPDADRKWRGKLIVAKRRRLDEGTTCSVCGAQFCVVNSRQIKARSPRKTCGSPECKSEIKRRAQRASAEARKAARHAEDPS